MSLQSEVMAVKDLQVDDKNNDNVSLVLYVKFWVEKHFLVKHFTFFKTFAINNNKNNWDLI